VELSLSARCKCLSEKLLFWLRNYYNTTIMIQKAAVV